MKKTIIFEYLEHVHNSICREIVGAFWLICLTRLKKRSRVAFFQVVAAGAGAGARARARARAMLGLIMLWSVAAEEWKEMDVIWVSIGFAPFNQFWPLISFRWMVCTRLSRSLNVRVNSIIHYKQIKINPTSPN